MHRWQKTILGVTAFVIPLLGGIAGAATDPAPPPPVSARAAELVDGLSGKVLYEKNAHEELPMASVTKLMTLYLAVKAIDKKDLSLRELVPVSEEAYRVGGSQIWLEPGERMSVDQLLKAIAIGSANDAAYALGEYLGGSVNAFVEDMNHTARSLGMTSTHFSNPHGLHQSDHYTSAHDLALLAEKAVRLPLLLHYTSMWQDKTIRNGKGGTLWLINHNRLMRQFPGMDGLKTGYTSQAGFCMVATAQRNGTRMIAVILGAPTSKDRFQDASALLSWGFQHYRTVELSHRGRVVGSVAVRRGTESQVNAIYQSSHYLTLPSQAGGQVVRQVTLPHRIDAPVALHQRLGYETVSIASHEVARVPLVAQRAVNRVHWFGSAIHFWWKIAG